MGIVEFFEKYQTVIYPSVIAITALGYKVFQIVKKKIADMQQADTEANRIKNQEKFVNWEHMESMAVISRIQKSCNLYKDKSKADRVAYLQLENGTIAASRLCNMFVSCLCEDNRYSACMKELPNLQRVPYSRLAAWAEALYKVASSTLGSQKYLHLSTNSEILEVINKVYLDKIGTQLAAPVFDHNNTFVGVVVFDYKRSLGDCDIIEESVNELLDLRAAVYNCLINYHESRKEHMKALNIREVPNG